MPLYKSLIVPAMKAGNKCLIVAHANTIRTLVKHIDGISDEDIKSMTIPTGIPILYRLDKDMKPVDPQLELEFRYLVEPKGYVSERVTVLHTQSISHYSLLCILSALSLLFWQLYVGYFTCTWIPRSLSWGLGTFTGHSEKA